MVSFENLEIEKAIKILHTTGILQERPTDPGHYILHPEFVESMEKVIPVLNQFTDDKEVEEIVTGLAVLGYMDWKKSSTKLELGIVARYITGLYQDAKNQDLEEFLASLRLHETLDNPETRDLKKGDKYK